MFSMAAVDMGKRKIYIGFQVTTTYNKTIF